jgi:putative zinc finger protein
MCDFSGRLIAWLDGELAADEAGEVGRHLRVCAECRGELNIYERLSGAVDACCEAAMLASAPRRQRYGKAVALGVSVAAVVAVVALMLAWPRGRHNVQPSARPAPVAVPTIEEAQAAPAPKVPAKALHRLRAAVPAQSQEARWPIAEPAIQITIPAEAVFPPGAVPEGVSFVADVRIPAGGSPQQLF